MHLKGSRCTAYRKKTRIREIRYGLRRQAQPTESLSSACRPHSLRRSRNAIRKQLQYVERNLRCYSLDRIGTKLRQASESAIQLVFLVMNLMVLYRRKAKAFFAALWKSLFEFVKKGCIIRALQPIAAWNGKSCVLQEPLFDILTDELTILFYAVWLCFQAHYLRSLLCFLDLWANQCLHLNYKIPSYQYKSFPFPLLLWQFL